MRTLSPRWLIPGLAAFAVSSALFGWALAINHEQFVDVDVFRSGGTAAGTGHDLYRHYFGDHDLYFTYTPFAAVVFVPLAWLAAPAAHLLWTMLSVAALAGTVWITLGMLGVRAGKGRAGLAAAITAGALWLQPVMSNMTFGQINCLITFLILADMSKPDSHRGKGALIGVVAGIKLLPGVFILYLLYTRRWRAAANAIGTFAATVIIGALLLPHDAADYWLKGIFKDATRVGDMAWMSNESVNGIMARWMSQPFVTWGVRYVVMALTVMIAIEIAATAHKRGQELAAIFVTALASLLGSPISWAHHWVWFVPFLMLIVHMGLLRRGWARRLLLGAAGLTVLLIAAWPIGYWIGDDNGPFSWSGLVDLAAYLAYDPYGYPHLPYLLGATYVVIGLSFLGAGAVWLARIKPAADNVVAVDPAAAPHTG